jgi:outer membrane protein assembly factor BamB
MVMKQLLLVLAACAESTDRLPGRVGSACVSVKTAPTQPTPPSVRLVVRDRVLDGDGHVVATIAGLEPGRAALPVGGDHYAVGSSIADALTATAHALPAIYDPREGDYAIGESFLIASPLNGELQRVDVTTGTVQWQVHASPGGLTIAGDQVIGTECTADGSREWVEGYALADGARRFITPTMPGCSSSWLVTPHYVAQQPWSGGHASVFDLAGHHRFGVDRHAIGLAEIDRDLVVVTDLAISRVTDTGEQVWRIPTGQVAYADTASVTTLSGGDLLVEVHDRIADSGMAFWRIHPDGRVAWQATAAALDVSHSKYSNVAYFTVRSDKLYAISQASGGDFFERIDLRNGARELRCEPIGTCSSPEAAIPFVVGASLVSPDGKVLRTLRRVDSHTVAEPLGNHRFAVGDFEIDAAHGTVYAAFAPAQVRVVDGDHDRNAVVGLGTDGRVAWTRPLDGVRSVRGPDLAFTDTTVVASVMGTLRAFDRATGAIRWSAVADAFSLHVVGDTVYYVTCNEPTHDHWLYGRSLADGSQKFRSALVEGWDPRLSVDPRHEIAVERRGSSIVFDHAGRELYRMPDQIASAHAIGDDLVVVSDKRVARFTDTGKPVWSLPAPAATFAGDAEFVDLPDGDLVIADYCAISDDGVEIQRVGPDGARRWKVMVPGLGVAHSEYLQRVYLERRGDTLYVVSQASGGAFMERVELSTGVHRSLLRL